MKWVEGKWDSEFWRSLYRDSEKKFPYDTEAYGDSLGIEWGAMIGENIALPMAFKKVMGFKSGYLPFGIQQWGPIGKSANKSEEIFKALDQFPGFFKKVDICFHRPKDWDVKKENWHFKNFRLQRFSLIPNYEVTLSNDYEKVYNGFSTQAKRNLKSSSKYELTMFEYDTPDTLIREFSERQALRYGVSKKFIDTIRQTMYHLLHIGKGAVWTVYGPGNRFQAGVFITFSGNRMTLLFSAVSDQGRESNAMTHLINELILFGCGRWEILDFEGSKEEGLARYYSGFGAQLSPYIRYQRWAIL